MLSSNVVHSDPRQAVPKMRRWCCTRTPVPLAARMDCCPRPSGSRPTTRRCSSRRRHHSWSRRGPYRAAKASRERTARQPAAAAAARARAPSPTLAAFSGKYGAAARRRAHTRECSTHVHAKQYVHIYMKFLRQRENLTRLCMHSGACHSESAPVPVGVAAVSA